MRSEEDIRAICDDARYVTQRIVAAAGHAAAVEVAAITMALTWVLGGQHPNIVGMIESTRATAAALRRVEERERKPQ